jgi:hypothetical protein
MAADNATGILEGIEHSGLGQAIRQSVWVYPAANVTHVVGLALFAGALFVMDLRLLGAFAATRPTDVITPARRAAALALIVMLGSGACLFIAEASHIAQNPVFLTKMALVVSGLLLALAHYRPLTDYLSEAVAHEPIPIRFRIVAALSITLWLTVAGLGRFIAYV